MVPTGIESFLVDHVYSILLRIEGNFQATKSCSAKIILSEPVVGKVVTNSNIGIIIITHPVFLHQSSFSS